MSSRASDRQPTRTGGQIIRCAWCGSFTTNGQDWVEPALWRTLLADPLWNEQISDGICPGCFAELEPGVPYPGVRGGG